MTTYCQICRSEIPEPDEDPGACPHCGAITIVIGVEKPGEDRYHDARFLERQCDHCGRAYQGPAVYCSLDCALADA